MFACPICGVAVACPMGVYPTHAYRPAVESMASTEAAWRALRALAVEVVAQCDARYPDALCAGQEPAK
jgi:hypothetical protein